MILQTVWSNNPIHPELNLLQPQALCFTVQTDRQNILTFISTNVLSNLVLNVTPTPQLRVPDDLEQKVLIFSGSTILSC